MAYYSIMWSIGDFFFGVESLIVHCTVYVWNLEDVPFMVLEIQILQTETEIITMMITTTKIAIIKIGFQHFVLRHLNNQHKPNTGQHQRFWTS